MSRRAYGAMVGFVFLRGLCRRVNSAGGIELKLGWTGQTRVGPNRSTSTTATNLLAAWGAGGRSLQRCYTRMAINRVSLDHLSLGDGHCWICA
jgi:hypothetical protein